jgi:hypothetical protein
MKGLFSKAVAGCRISKRLTTRNHSLPNRQSRKKKEENRTKTFDKGMGVFVKAFAKSFDL